jgi:hypothetical protein
MVEAFIFSGVVMSPVAYLWWRFNPWRDEPPINPLELAAQRRADNALARKSTEYRQWREAVFKKDGYRCVWYLGNGFKCGAMDNIEADHIFPFAYFPELRHDVNNGRTYCSYHHKQTITYGTGSKVFYERIINAARP